MKIAFVAHAGRSAYELDWLSAMPVEEVRILDADFGRYPQPPAAPIRYCEVRSWDARLLGSTARLVHYRDFERYIDDVDVIVVLELFSSLSYQFVRYGNAHSIPVVVL